MTEPTKFLSGSQSKTYLYCNPNYQFNCPHCGSPITIFWPTPPAERDLSLTFPIECADQLTGCGRLVARLGSEGWRIA